MLPEVLDLHEDDDPVDLSVPVTDAMTARHLLIELASNARKQNKLKATLASVKGEYEGRLAALAEREELVRQSLLNFCQMYGSVSFPDVGGCSTRKTGGKLRVADSAALVDWLAASGRDDLYETTTTYEPTKEALDYAREAFEADGELAPGIERVPEGESLTVRGIK